MQVATISFDRFNALADEQAQARILAEEMGRASAWNPIGGMGVMMFGPTLLEYGSEEQKREHIPGITKGEIRSQLGGGPVETFGVGQSFFEPPGATHLVSANASTTEPAELIAVFVADEGAQLTTLIE